MIFVIDSNKKPLSPCSETTAKNLLKEKKAAIFRRFPFTIILKKSQELSVNTQEYRLKIDYGSRHTGLAILNNNNVVWLAQLDHRTTIKSNLDSKRSLRKGRRNRHTRYRLARFMNRKRSVTIGWLPPSLLSRVQNIKHWIEKLQKLIPLTSISYENCKFDTQLITNVNINGIEYQQGELAGYEIREYLLEKFNRICCYCGKKDIPLEIEHIIPKSRGGTNKIDNLCLACHKCNQDKGNKTAEEFGYKDIQKQAKESLKECAIINATRWKVYNILIDTGLPVECGSGGLTKFNRTNLKLPKDHCIDACCIGKSTPKKLYFKTGNILHIKAMGRGSHQVCRVNKYGFPTSSPRDKKIYYGFQTNDIVKGYNVKGKYIGNYQGNVVCNKSKGNFTITDNKINKRISVHVDRIKLLQKFDGYTYKYEKWKSF